MVTPLLGQYLTTTTIRVCIVVLANKLKIKQKIKKNRLQLTILFSKKQGSISSVMIPKLLELVSLGSESFFSDENFGEPLWGWGILAIRNVFWNQSWKGGVTKRASCPSGNHGRTKNIKTDSENNGRQFTNREYVSNKANDFQQDFAACPAETAKKSLMI